MKQQKMFNIGFSIKTIDKGIKQYNKRIFAIDSLEAKNKLKKQYYDEPFNMEVLK